MYLDAYQIVSKGERCTFLVQQYWFCLPGLKSHTPGGVPEEGQRKRRETAAMGHACSPFTWSVLILKNDKDQIFISY